MAATSSNKAYDGVVVGSGPNGLSAAIRLAQAGLSVVVFEANETIGGGSRTTELTLPGFKHDVCSAVHPLGAASPFFRQLRLEKFGLSWVQPTIPLAHPLGENHVAVLQRSVAQTARELGRDQAAYERLMSPVVSHWNHLANELLQPVMHLPRHPVLLARFAWRGFRSTTWLAESWFRGEESRALLAGIAAHSFLPLNQIPSAAFAILLGVMGHAVGWPFPRGGSQEIANALAAVLRSLGGEIITGWPVDNLSHLPKARVVLLDITPRQLVRMAGENLPPAYRARLERFRYGPGIFKIDYALRGPIPWTAPACARAGTVHVCGSLDEVARAEREVSQGKLPERPFVLLAQPTLFDPIRAPQDRHVAWAYCHAPSGSSTDMTRPIEDQIERFAPGFRDLVLARYTANCVELERKNANLIGGAIAGGLADLRQLIARPLLSPTPYRVPLKGVYLCSASTPPGAGVHGMCGFHAAEAALRDWYGGKR
jgi:phytoene dehydrogenase-like protein